MKNKKSLFIGSGFLAAVFLVFAATMAGAGAQTTSSSVSFTANVPQQKSAVAAPIQKPAKFYYAAWLPFWKSESGSEDVAIHLDSINEISPFSYKLNSTGGLIDQLDIGSGSWDGWFSAVHDLNVKVIPTVAWFDGPSIQKLLSSSGKRRKEEDLLAGLVKEKNFNGIDIDFESMLPATRPYFSLFIQGLAERLHPSKKLLTCTVVPRTPLASLYNVIPPNVVYSENYSVLNQYCDEVRVMAYDQGPIDLQLDASKGNGTLYAPVADLDWAKKVVSEAVKFINPRKIMLGVPTYGYEYQVSWDLGVTKYERVRSFTFLQAMDRADALGVAPARNNAGELSFTFASSTHVNNVPSVLVSEVPSTQPVELKTQNPNATTTFFVSFPDAQSSADKIAFAKKMNLRGVVFFKADGELDPATWLELK